MARGMLARGSRGLQVQALQENFTFLGINPGPIDGVFGPKPEAAAKRFQKLQNLEAGRIVGPKTREGVAARKRSRKVATRRREGAAKPTKGVVRVVGKGAAPRAMPTKPAGTETMAAEVAPAKMAAGQP